MLETVEDVENFVSSVKNDLYELGTKENFDTEEYWNDCIKLLDIAIATLQSSEVKIKQ